MPVIYDNLGIRFLYPENWTVAEEETINWPRALSVSAPGSGFLSLCIHQWPAKPEELAEFAVRAMGEMYPGMDVEAARETIAGTETIGSDLHFFCLDLIVTCHVRAFRVGRRSLVVMYQAEDREFNELHRVFQAMVHSLILNPAP
jgi:hypothetical protein